MFYESSMRLDNKDTHRMLSLFSSKTEMKNYRQPAHRLISDICMFFVINKEIETFSPNHLLFFEQLMEATNIFLIEHINK